MTPPGRAARKRSTCKNCGGPFPPRSVGSWYPYCSGYCTIVDQNPAETPPPAGSARDGRLALTMAGQSPEEEHMTSSLDGAAAEVAPVVSDATLQLFAQMAAGIPEADDSEAYESIVSQLLGAAGIDDLNAPWDTEAADRLAGHQLVIQDLTRRPSEYIGGLGMYLVAKGIDQANGERFTWTTGSIAIVAQLARAYFLGGLPIVAQVVVGDANPRTGRKPQHLQIVALGGAKPAAQADGAPF